MLIYLSLIESDEEKEKFEIIYTEYRNLMYCVANRILENPQDSEDVVHQAFLKVIDVLDKISHAKSPQTRGLVVTIVERKAIDLYRRRKRIAFLPLDETYFSNVSSTEADMIADKSIIAQAIAGLSDIYRQVIVLKYDCGLSSHEIALVLDMTDANAKKTIQRAKAKLQKILEEMEECV